MAAVHAAAVGVLVRGDVADAVPQLARACQVSCGRHMQLFFPPEGARKSFLTFHHYIRNVAQFLEAEYGREPAERYGSVYAATSELTDSVQGRRILELGIVRRYLKAWLTNLVCLQREADADDFFEEKNAWTPVQGWYAVHGLMCALASYLSPGRKVDHARSCSNARQLICDRGLLPYPWSASMEGGFEDGKRVDTPINFRRDPDPVNNLSAPTVKGFEDSYALFLATTLDKRAERIMNAIRSKPEKGRTRRNISTPRKDEIYRNAGPVTLFDALYRLRIRANYGDLDTFVEGCESASEAQAFARALHVVTDATVAALESVLVAYAGAGPLESTLEAMQRRMGDESAIEVRLAFHQIHQ